MRQWQSRPHRNRNPRLQPASKWRVVFEMTPESVAALADVRRVGHFEWHTVNALAFVLYVYASAIRRGQWDRVALGIGFLAVEIVWEIFNALVLHHSQHAALWMIGGKSSYLIYVGLNVEIALMFAVAPFVLFHLLPADRQHRVAFGLRSRLLVPIALGLFCVSVETLLNRVGALVWTWSFWRWPNMFLIAFSYCAPFVLLVWIHDHAHRQTKILGAITAVVLALAAHWLFAIHLGWV